jgi:hypothetical protein
VSQEVIFSLPSLCFAPLNNDICDKSNSFKFLQEKQFGQGKQLMHTYLLLDTAEK